jgi:hypothetical protein
VVNAKLRNDSVYRADLNTSTATDVAKLRRLDMVLSIRRQ